MRNLEGLCIFMMGATGGMGRATALQIAKPGVKFAIASIDRSGLEVLAAELEEKGSFVFSQMVDNTNSNQIERFMNAAAEALGGADILINFAGLTVDKPIDILTEEEYDLVMDVNMKGMVFSSKHFLNHIDISKGGKIFNFRSMAAKRSNAISPQYCAAKIAVNMFSEGLAKQVKDKNVTVSVINPGPADTAFQMPGNLNADKFMKAQDVAELMEFLLTRDSRLVYHSIFFECFEYYRLIA